MHYFAYGSNLHTRRLRARTPSARFVAVASLPGHQLRFHKKSDRDGSGKCDAYRTGRAEDVVLGVVWELDPEDKNRLDEIEGVGAGYTVESVEVVTADGALAAFTYRAEPHCIDASVRPFEWYKRYVVEGAREHGLDSAYVEGIEGVVADRDPDRERARGHWG